MIKKPSSTVIGGAGIWTPSATIIGSLSNLTQLIKSIFANDEQGFAYDPNDLSTLYQDAAGTIPVTGVGQPVGLVLDKSRGLSLSAERCVNGDFSAGLTRWINNGNYWVVTNGRAYHGLSSVLNTLDQALPSPSQAMLKVTFDMEVISGTGQINIAPSGYAMNIGVGVKKTYTVYAPVGTTSIQFKRSAPGVAAEFYVDNVSIKEIAGNHAYQAVSSMRPLLQDAPRRVAYDAVDDKLITNLPAQLTGCTVIRAVPNVGTQILMNQTIPTPYNDNTDHCGLIVINRALTASETSQITRLFNKSAGV